MEEKQRDPAPDQHPARDDERDDEEIPTAIDTGRSPRPSQAEGDRETVEEDLEERE